MEEPHVHKVNQQTLDAVRFDAEHIGDVINSIIADKSGLEIVPIEHNQPRYKTSLLLGVQHVPLADYSNNRWKIFSLV